MNSPISSAAVERQRENVRQCIASLQWEAAQAALSSLLQLVPDDLDALLDLADVLFQRGYLRDSTSLMLRVARQLPRDAPFIIKVAQRLVAVGETLAARGCLDLLAQAPAPPPELLVGQVHLRFMLGDQAEMLKET